MNFKFKSAAVEWPGASKFLLAMKLFAIIMFIALTQVHAKGYSQNITLNEKDVNIGKIIHLIEKQSGYHFIYDNKLDLTKLKVSKIFLKDASIDNVLRTCFTDLPVSYKIIQNTIALKKKEATDDQRIVLVKKVTGTITDSKGQGIPGVSVKVKGTSTVVVTDSKGSYTITVPDASSVLIFTYIGFTAQELPVGNRSEINVVLQESQVALDDVVVVGYGTTKQRNLTTAVVRVKSEDLNTSTASNFQQSL